MDERLIKNYGEEKLANQLSKTDEMVRIITERLQRNEPSNIVKADDLALADAVDNYIVKMIMTDPYKLDRNVIIQYRDKLFNIFKNNPEIAYDSILFKKDIALKLFTTPQIKEIITYKMHTSANANNDLKKIINTPHLTVSEEIIRYAEYQIGNNHPQITNMLDNLYKYLIENRKENSSLRAKEFILRYTSHLAAKDLGIDSPKVYISNTKIGGKTMTPTNLGTSYGNTGLITINRESLIKNITNDKGIPAISEYMMVVSHETKHSAQSYEYSNNKISQMSFEMFKRIIFDRYLSDKEYNEYHTNYIHSEIEADANDYGWYFTHKLTSKYAPNEAKILEELVSKRIKNSYQELTATKIDKIEKKHIEKWQYNVETLDKIIKQNPSLINQYQPLKAIYKSNGEMRNFIELLQEENKYTGNEKEEIAKILSDYYTHQFTNGNILKIDKSKLSEEDAFLFYEKLADMLIEEYKNINHSIKMFNKYEKQENFRQKEFLKVNINRIKRINQLVNYLNNSNEIINKLAEIDTQRDGNKRAFGFKLGYIEKMYQNFAHYVEKIDTYGITDEEIIAKLNDLKNNSYDTKGRGK